MRNLRSLLRRRNASKVLRQAVVPAARFVEGLENRIFFDTSTIAVMAPSNMATQGSTVQFTATITPGTVGDMNFPTGMVTFYDNGTQISVPQTLSGTNYTASVNASMATLGANNITAVYTGDSNFTGSNNNGSPYVETVTAPVKTATTTTITTPTSTVALNTGLTFTVTVNGPTGPAAPTGTVTVVDTTTSTTLGTISGAALVGSGTSATGTLNLPGGFTTAGVHSIVATYGGDSNFNGSSNMTALAVTVLSDTTTTLAGPTASTAGTQETFTASVTPVAPGFPGSPAVTGTVTFYNGLATLGTAPVVAGVATYMTTLSSGSNSITASYGGNASAYSGSTSNTVTDVVSAASASMTLTAIPPNIGYGSTSTFTANVTGASGTPTGMVDFYNASTDALLGTGTLSSGVATFADSTLPVGTTSVTASYTGNGTYNPIALGTGPNASVTVTTGAPVLTLNVSDLTPAYAQPVTFTMTAAPSTMGAASPSGSVTVLDGTVALGTVPLVAGTAMFTTSMLSVGMHSITFSYPGDTNYMGGASAAQVVVVGLDPTTTTVVTSNPSITYGGMVTYTATVTPTYSPGVVAPTGTVTFYSNGMALGPGITINAAGKAVLVPVVPPAAGTDTITAVYSGDTNYATSTSMGISQGVNTAASTTLLSAAPTTVAEGDAVVFTATVMPLTAGTVTFFDGITQIGTPVTLVGNVATLTDTTLSLGSHSITAEFNGNATYSASTSNAVTITVSNAATATTVVSNVTTTAQGGPVTFTATVAPQVAGNPTPTGTVTFYDFGSTDLGTATLVNGSTTLTVTTLALGTNAITAVYSGDSGNLASTSSAVNVAVTTVNSNTTTTTLTSSAASVAAGQSLTFTAVVAPAIKGEPTPTGNVTFYNGTTIIGAPVTLSNGIATLSTVLPPGVDSVTAVYSGVSSVYSSSVSAALSESVGLGTPQDSNYTIALTAAATLLTFGQSDTFTATLTPLNGDPTAVGTVTFSSNGLTLGAVPVNSSGVATYSTILSPGTNGIVATFTGGVAPVQSTSLPITVDSSVIPTLGGGILPGAGIAGQQFHAQLPVLLTNHGTKLSGAFTLNIYADTNATLDSTGVLLKSFTRRATLNVNQTRMFMTSLSNLPTTLAGGKYYIIVQAVDPQGASNTAATPSTVSVTPAIVTLSTTVGALTIKDTPDANFGTVLVTITNSGNENATGPFTLTLEPVLKGTSTPLANQTLTTVSASTITVRAGQTRRFRLHFQMPALTTGSYLPYVSLSIGSYTASATGTTPFAV